MYICVGKVAKIVNLMYNCSGKIVNLLYYCEGNVDKIVNLMYNCAGKHCKDCLPHV